ncbi:surface lipoprotein assembly modifier [Thiovibrio sp. JS02]
MKRVKEQQLAGSLAFILMAVGLTASSAAAGEAKDWSLTLGAGFEYDDNLSVEEQDLVSDQSDTAAVFELEGGYRFGEKFPGNPEITYNFYQSLYDDYSEYDLQSHTLSLAGEEEFGKATAGLDYSYSYTTLDSDGFLQTHGLTPGLGYALTSQVYLHGSYIFLDKDFRQSGNNPRDAVNNSLGADLFYFFRENQKDFLQLGYRLEDENASGSEYEYQGQILKVSVQMVFAEETLLRLAYKYNLKDYDNITESIGVEREDTRQAFQVTVSRPLYGRLFGRLDYQHLMNDSNLPATDYTENIIYAGLELKL